MQSPAFRPVQLIVVPSGAGHSTAPQALEYVKIGASLVTPLLVAIVGFFINRSLKRLEQVQWRNQKLLEKRIDVYDSIAPHLNRLLCFFTWRGDWKNISPEELLRTKRELDMKMYIYRYIFPASVWDAYKRLESLSFLTFSGRGKDALIRANIVSGHGDRRTDSNYTWDAAWDARFTSTEAVTSEQQIQQAYQSLMMSLTASFGVGAMGDSKNHAPNQE
jgi:hypothetical protein